MDLSTQYLGFTLPHPFIPGAGPLADDLDSIRRLEDAGAPMIVLRSLFEEQIVQEQMAMFEAIEGPGESFAEAASYLPEPAEYAFGPHEYLEHIRRVREAVAVPVVASINGRTRGGWLNHAKLIEVAGASALELNIYDLATDPARSSRIIENETIEIVRRLRSTVKIPLAVKLSPFYTSIAHLAAQLDVAGVDALVMFNRFYQPDIDVEALETVPVLHLSDSTELLLRLRWLAVVYGHVKAALAITGGVHTPIDAVKAIMCGAGAVQAVSSLLKFGPTHLRTLRGGLESWLVEHEYESLQQMCGSMSLQRCPDPGAFERANYMQILQSWRN